VVVGWTPDGKKIVYKSGGESYADFTKLYLVAAEGGVPEALPMWRADGGSYSPDASHMAYVPNSKWQAAWKRYRGGQTTPIYIVSLRDLQLVKIPRENSNDANPVWFETRFIFFRTGTGQ